jgi:fatty-acyl-CoA synthase
LAPAEIGFILNDSGCSVVIAHSSLLAKLEPVRADVPVQTYVVLPDSDDAIPAWAQPFDVLQGQDELPIEEAPQLTEADPMALIYTSGTTGTPKGAIWTHGTTLGTSMVQALRWGFSEDSVGSVPGPLYHVGGFEAVIAPMLLVHGKAVYLSTSGFSVDHMLDVIRAEDVTDMLCFSFFLHDMLRLEDLEDRISPSLRRVIDGADTLMPWAVDEFHRRLPHVKLVQVYGSTETGGICTSLEPPYFKDQPKSVGRPMPLNNVRVAKPDKTIAGVDEVGEIEVQGPGVCAGYWQRPDANAESFVDGWFKTGDLGSVNTNGFLTLEGRSKDMIRSSGENIYPAEIEKVLTRHPAIKDAAVVGVPDPRFQEVGCAVLVSISAEAPDEDELRSYCREHLAGYKVPKYFIWVDDLPRNASSKVLKYVLREQYREIGVVTR